MRINQLNIRFFALIACLVSMMLIMPFAKAGDDPVGLLQSIANNMLSGLKANKATLKTKPQIVYSLANRYVVPFADLPEMSRRVLPPATWNSATPAQRQEFQKLFTRTLVRTYASALTSYTDQVVKFYPVRGGAEGNTVEVSSEIVSPDTDPVRVVYRLIRTGSGWRLYDMSVEGVSLIQSFRSQFSDILSQGNMESLLNRLRSHNTGKQ